MVPFMIMMISQFLYIDLTEGCFKFGSRHAAVLLRWTIRLVLSIAQMTTKKIAVSVRVAHAMA